LTSTEFPVFGVKKRDVVDLQNHGS